MAEHRKKREYSEGFRHQMVQLYNAGMTSQTKDGIGPKSGGMSSPATTMDSF